VKAEFEPKRKMLTGWWKLEFSLVITY
jgi:hypothetical protein